ncbi:protein of unknown function DUF305 [Crinalium epipsammum PCC 9333]|uniref:DUF305 domain-containing protein n=1 Tax=Crinalium epipsammum PCC 9333 TaxID=1173022 RepID=K9W2Y7_9CYAN|nr:DUF305 domain-containing protein [Crinalium epipsammum]AFZ14164.1 protein of unknown function DUF305 [Crinalium epipsammum PCC 9333]
MKTSILITFVAIASVTGAVITGCSTSSQTPNQVSSTTSNNSSTEKKANHSSHSGHGSGNHDMAMDLGSADANYDLRFIDAMTPHHQGAVEMAKEAQQKSQRPEIKKLASEIINAQNKEIGQLKQWRLAWYPKAGTQLVAYGGAGKSTVPMSDEQKQSMMMSQDLGAADAEFDLRFINAMIPHHEGAITMANDALAKSKQTEIKKLSQNIVASQQKEIDQMKQWRTAWYKK